MRTLDGADKAYLLDQNHGDAPDEEQRHGKKAREEKAPFVVNRRCGPYP